MQTEQAINNDREFVAQVIRALPNVSSEIKQGWIENPRGLSKVLAKALCPHAETVEFPVWKTIKLGTHDSVGALRQSLKDNRNRIGDWGDDILGKTELAKSETEVVLHTATVKELTGKDVATNREINEAIRLKSYDLCPAEVGPQLRLQYPDQPKGEWLRIAMEPITDSGGGLEIFYVGHDGGERCLCGGSGRPDHQWHGDIRFVFVSRK